jgi:hypothetical protein
MIPKRLVIGETLVHVSVWPAGTAGRVVTHPTRRLRTLVLLRNLGKGRRNRWPMLQTLNAGIDKTRHAALTAAAREDRDAGKEDLFVESNQRYRQEKLIRPVA